MNIIVAGIGTGVGKTVVSAVLVKMLKADYWKPISCGLKKNSDSYQIQNLVGDVSLYPEAYHFSAPLSPHHAASLEGIYLHPEKLIPPSSDRTIVIESVGGVMVPLNDTSLTLDVFSKWGFPWVLVSRNYLGSINHTLLTVEILKQRGVDLLGIIFNGEENAHTEKFITHYTKLPVIGRMEQEEKMDATVIERYSHLWKKQHFLGIA